MKGLLVFVLALLQAWVAAANDESISLSVDNKFRDVTVTNEYDDLEISVYWKDQSKPNNDGVFMFDLAAQGSTVMNTMAGHMFYADFKDVEAAKLAGFSTPRCKPSAILIGPDNKNEYSFGTSSPVLQTAPSVLSHPLISVIGRGTTSMSAIFRCLAPKVDYYFDDGGEGTYQGTLDLGKETTSATYEGHTFFFTEHKNKKNVLARHVMDKHKVLYVIEDPTKPPPTVMIDHVKKDNAFREAYFNRTGLMWRHYYGPKGPRPAPTLFMWPATTIGEDHNVTTSHGYWTCNDETQNCQENTEALSLQLKVVSLQPRVFIIENFLSNFEADHIVDYAKSRIKDSIVGSEDGGGSFKSNTRTSKNTWVPRTTDQVTETLFRRAADLLNVDESILHSNKNVEDLQVVHYVNGQKYDSHHDWGVNGHPEDRLITLLLYLTDQPDPNAGGETAFPKGAGGKGFKVAPKRGTAILFYDLLEDGNGDDLALHAALPVHRGEKWLANFWVW